MMNEITNFSASTSNLPYLFAKISALDLSLGYVISAKIRKSTRSIEQNNWARGYARDSSSYFGYTPDEMYDTLMYKHNPKFVIDKETGESIRMPGSFSKLNTADAAKVQEQIEIWGSSMGFYWDREAA